jgi:hypothetical protein
MSADRILFEFASARLGRPFAWGTDDCAMLSFDAVRAITGRDPAPELRGAYSTGAEAVALLRKLGGLRGVARSHFGAEIPVDEATDGDIALIDRHRCTGETEEHGALGVFWRGMILSQGAYGASYAPRDAARAAWRLA